ncbi:remorin-like [Gossypium australe]|uniref:Remorin-like n=1 Tax=Gossypium australe TaxID=47621 RepID=A0A5B6VLK3_9ROSI|nr:remorin-like [Gossypium australe]
MADVEEPKKLESETSSDPPPPPTEAAVEKSVTPPPPTEEKPADSTEKPTELIEKAVESTEKKSTEVSVDRDAVLARVATEKRISLINAWEESEKSKAENKYQLSSPCLSVKIIGKLI